MLHAALDFAPHGVLAVEEAGIIEADEELAVRTVGIARTSHRAGAANMRRAVELGLQVGKVAATHSCAGGVAALGHEARDHAVKHDAVVEAVFCKPADPLDMAGGQVWTKLDDHVAAGRKGQCQSVGHVLYLLGKLAAM